MIEQANSETAQHFTFNAADFDAETPLHSYDARWHDPNTGQLLNTDATECDIAEHGNYYRHAAANPTHHVDPSGL